MMQDYSEEDLLGKKYNDLLKISKAYGIKPSRRLKTEKLIEAILKYQQDEAALSLSQDAEAVMTALAGATHTHHEDELLLDIQFPDCDSKDSLDDNFEAAKDIVGDTGAGKQETEVLSTCKRKTHERSGTFDIEEEKEEKKNEIEVNEGQKKKRQRSSTFDLTTSSDVTLPIDEKQTEENSKQLSVLADKVTVRGSRRNGALPKVSLAQRASRTQATPVDDQPADKEGGSSSSVRRRSRTVPVDKDSLPASPWQPRVSLTSSAKRKRRSVTVTPSAPAPALRPSLHERRSRGTPSGAAPLTATTTTTNTASASKPVFTIGRGDKKGSEASTQDAKQGAQGKGASGIPRFLSYARRLKVPNFARIHEQAFQRMEGLDDYMGKRKARQDTLGSTTKKKEDKTEAFQPSVTTVKNLNFNFAEESPVEPQVGAESSQALTLDKSSDKQPQATCSSEIHDTVPKMPSPKSLKKATNTPKSARVSRRVTQNAIKPGKVLSPSTKKVVTRKSPRLSRKPSPKSTQKLSPKQVLKAPQKTRQKVSPKPDHRASPKTEDEVCPPTDQKVRTGHRAKTSPKPVSSKKISAVSFPAFGAHLKENCKPGKQSVSTPMVSKLPIPSDVASPASVRKRMQEYSQGLASRGTSYVPYKGAVKPLKSRSDLKTLAERKHNVKSSKEIREGQKSILRGVRINRRFELQMAKRGIAL